MAILLTEAQENELLLEAMPKIKNAVKNYVRRHISDIGSVPREDMVQECCIAYIKYIRHCDNEEELKLFPRCAVMGAMRRLIMVYQPLSMPKSTHSFSDNLSKMPATMSLDDADEYQDMVQNLVDGMARCWEDDKIVQMDFDSFLAGRPADQTLVDLRRRGLTMKQIGEILGIDKSTVLRRIRKLKQEYQDETGLEEDLL